MNKSLRQLFTIVVALFVILACPPPSSWPSEPTSSPTTHVTSARCTTNTAHRAGPFSPRTDRSSQNPILPTIRSRTSVPIPPANCMRRSPDSSPSAAWLERCRSVPQLAAVGPVGAAALAAVQVTVHRAGEQGRQYRNVHRSEDSAGRIQQPRQHGWRRSGHRAENRPYPRHGQHAQLRPEPAGQP